MADDIILKIDGIVGESALQGFEKQIDVHSVSWGMSNATSMSHGGGGGSGKVQFQDLHFTKHFDSASHALQLKCCNGTHVSKASVHFRKQGTGQKEYLTISLDDVMVSNFQGSNGGESFSLTFSKFKFEYKEQGKDGSMGGAKTMAWDVKAAKGA